METDVYANLIKAAEILTSPFGVFTAEQREAENYFMELRKLRFPYEFCRNALEKCDNDFVRYHLCSTIKDAVLREWLLLDSTLIENLWLYLLEYVCQRPKLPTYVTAEILLTVSAIIKRGTFDGKSGETDKLFQTVTQMISSNENNLLSLACQLLSSLCTEYCTSWRSSDVGITWDFHIRAKRHFENSDLKRILEFGLQMLNGLMSDGSSFASTMRANDYLILTNRLLNVVEAVLNWNFGSKYLPKRLTYSVEFAPAVSFHPPESWRQILLNTDVLLFFFQLHAKIRLNEQLAHQSLQCLVQLASLSGPIFPDEASRDYYLEFFVGNFVDLFTNEPSSSEVINFAYVAHKLFAFHPLLAIQRLPQHMLTNFLSLITRTTTLFCCKSALESVNDVEDTRYQEAYCKMLDGWSIQLKADGRSAEQAIYFNNAQQVFDCFWRCHLSPPTGTRLMITTKECEDMAETDEDDRDKFFDLLVHIGVFGRYGMERCLPTIYGLLEERILSYKTLCAQIVDDQSLARCSNQLHNLQEDLHWLLLITGFILVSEDIENVFMVPLDLLHYAAKLYNNKITDHSTTLAYLLNCLKDESETYDVGVDPIMKLIGSVFRWTVVEHNLLITGRLTLLSPQVGQTSIWCFRRLVCAFGDTDESLVMPLKSVARFALQSSSEISPILSRFVLEKFFGVMTKWCSEISLTKEVVSLLFYFIETHNRANEIAKDPFLLSELNKIKIHEMSPSTRQYLLRALVKVGSLAEYPEVHEKMREMILIPLRFRYESLMKTNISTDSALISEMLDLLDCFTGIAEAVQSNSVKVLFEYLSPIMETCPPLLASCKSIQTVVDSVLNLFSEVTQKMIMNLNDNNDAEKLYGFLLTLLRTYSANNIGKYVNFVNVDEEKTTDLLLVLRILTNILSKDVFIAIGSQESTNVSVCAASVTLLGLETVMPLMNNDSLKYPSLCSQYFKLITFTSELYAEKVLAMPNHMKGYFLESARLGLSFDYGTEIVKSSLDLLNALATFVCLPQNESNHEANEMKINLSKFVQFVFDVGLRASCEVDLLNDASITFFSLICCDQNSYRRFVNELIGQHQTDDVKKKLTTAFEMLVPSNLDFKQNSVRKEKRAFRDRFEVFLNDIQGLLCW